MLFKSAYSAQFFHQSLSSFSVLAWTDRLSLTTTNSSEEIILCLVFLSVLSVRLWKYSISTIFYFYFLTFYFDNFRLIKSCKNNTKNSHIAVTKIAQTFSILSHVLYRAPLLLHTNTHTFSPRLPWLTPTLNLGVTIFFNISASLPPPPFLCHQRVLYEMRKRV